MFTYENFRELAHIKDRGQLTKAIAEMPEDDVRTALAMALLAWDKSEQINAERLKRRPAVQADLDDA